MFIIRNDLRANDNRPSPSAMNSTVDDKSDIYRFTAEMILDLLRGKSETCFDSRLIE